MFTNHSKKVKELKAEISKIRQEQIDFIIRCNDIMKSVLDNDKRKFMYEVRQEDIDLIEDGKKYRAIRKIIS